jgi:hypothetical protein
VSDQEDSAKAEAGAKKSRRRPLLLSILSLTAAFIYQSAVIYTASGFFFALIGGVWLGLSAASVGRLLRR